MKKSIILLLLALAGSAFGTTSVINAFNSGELSPLLEGRTDIKKYYTGARTMENLIVLPHGGVTKRPGTYYVAAAKDVNVVCRLIPFEFSVEQAYIIEMGNLYMRFYKDGAQILSSAGGVPYEISTPYLTADLFEIQFVQSADTMYFVHPDYEPRKLTRTGHTSWTMEIINFDRGPFLDQYVCLAESSEAAMNVLGQDNDSTASLVSGIGTAYGSIASINDDDSTTYYRRYGQVNTSGNAAVAAQMIVVIAIGNEVERIDSIEYTLVWENGSFGDIRTTAQTAECSTSTDNGVTYTTRGTSIQPSSVISGPFSNVTHVKLYLNNYTTSYTIYSQAITWAGMRLLEIKAYGTPVKATTCNYITPTNTATYDRTLAEVAVINLGGDPNEVRISCDAHGFLEGDYVVIGDTTNYNGLHAITGINDVNSFDIASAYTAETPAGTEEASSRIAMNSVSDTWEPNHVGARWQLEHTIPASVTKSVLSTTADTNDSTTIQYGRKYDFTTSGDWVGTVTLQRSYDGGSVWKDVIPHTSTARYSNIAYSDSEQTDDALYRVYATSMTSETCTAILVARCCNHHDLHRCQQCPCHRRPQFRSSNSH